VLARPIDPWLAGIALLVTTAVLLALAVRRARRLEVEYAAE